MDPLVISELSTLAEVEEAIAKVRASNGAPLQLTKDSVNKRKGALHDAARLQLLVTWARTAKERELRFHAANTVEAVLAEMCDYAPGIAALRLSNGLVVGDTFVSRRASLERAAEKMNLSDQMKLTSIVRGRTIDLTCVSGSKIQYLRPLFTVRNRRAVKKKGGMFLMLSDLSEQIAKDDADLVSPSFLRACGVFASELFANTQEHATSDHKGEPYLEHVEGIIVSWIQMDDSQFGQDFQGHARLSDFWRRELAPTRGGTAMGVRCLQLSFFDSGPGFASRSTGLTAEDMDIAHERAVMLKCLQKNVTTKRQSGAGQGLPDVLEELRATGGLIRIRSGRHCIFNSFSPGETRDLFDFADWTPGALSPVSGAVVSILIPLRRT